MVINIRPDRLLVIRDSIYQLKHTLQIEMEEGKWEITTKPPLDRVKIMKVVGVFLAIAVPCMVLYSASYNNDLGFSYFKISSWSTVRELREALKAASTEEKTVILTTLNDAWAEPNSIFDVFLESFRIGNNTARLLNHLLVIAVDEKAYNRCQAKHLHCYHFKSKLSNEKIAHEARFMSPTYLEMMWERLAFLHTILSLGYNFVFTDTDVMWFRDPFPHFNPSVDFQTSCDQYNGNPSDLSNLPNNGFNFVRSNTRTIKFYKFWVASRSRYPGLHEQNVFNRIKHSPFVKKLGLTIRFLDTDYFGGFCKPSRDFNKVCTMHANCCVGSELKIADLNIMLKDWKMYMSSPTNRTVSTQFHWNVPHNCHM